MSKLVEKMAETFFAAWPRDDTSWAKVSDRIKDEYRAAARAALAVVMAEMREPSEAVVDAGHDVESHLWRGEIAGIWSAMLAQFEKEQAGG